MACRSIFFQNNKNPEEVGSQMARSSECVDKANFLEQFVLIWSIGCAMCTLIGSRRIGSFLLARECTSECISSGCWAHFSDSQCHHVSSCDGSSWQQNTTVIIAFPVTSVTFRGVSMLCYSVQSLGCCGLSYPTHFCYTSQPNGEMIYCCIFKKKI